MKDKFLQLTLDAGSTRILNCLNISQRITQSPPPHALLFKNRFLNRAILIKDRPPIQPGQRPPSTDKTRQQSPQQAEKSRIGIKLYFPFDPEKIYDGGQYVYFNPDTIQSHLISSFGRPEGLSQDDYDHDIKILQALNSIPTLDPFLVRDRLNGENIPIDDRYLMLTPEEWKQVQHHIRNKIRPMVAMAMPDGLTNAEEHIKPMMEAFWNARDLKALDPLIAAFRLPRDQTAEMIYAWKGIAFFEYHYSNVQAKVVEFARWLGGNIFSHLTLPKTELIELTSIRDQIRQKTKDHLSSCTLILKDYSESYDKLFQRQESPTPFINFLNESPKYFWALGESIMRMLHATETWRRSAQRDEQMRLSATDIRLLLLALDDLL